MRLLHTLAFLILAGTVALQNHVLNSLHERVNQLEQRESADITHPFLDELVRNREILT